MSKRALIIGGSSGIGKATAENLLEQGVSVHVVGNQCIKTFRVPEIGRSPALKPIK